MKGETRCGRCGAHLTSEERERNSRENREARYDANAYWCDECQEALEADAEGGPNDE